MPVTMTVIRPRVIDAMPAVPIISRANVTVIIRPRIVSVGIIAAVRIVSVIVRIRISHWNPDPDADRNACLSV
jgi:hypothetical protein